MPEVRYASNSIDDFEQGGLYNGGSGIFKEVRYTLWDYEGRQPPDSAVAVHVTFTPTDGSNEGKDVEIFWSVGPASDFAIDPSGGRVIILKDARKGQSSSSNWGFVLSKFKDNCGMSGEEQSKMLNTPKGIRVMEGADVTIARVDQPKREGLEDKDDAAKDRKYKKEILVPTRVKWAWEKGTGRAKAGAAAPTVAPSGGTSSVASRATMGQTAPPPAESNGAVAGSVTLASSLTALLNSSGGVVAFTDIPSQLLGQLADMDRAVRMAILKEAKSVDAIQAVADAQGWVFDGKQLAG